MINDTKLKRFLDRVADLTVIGLCTMIASLPLATGLAALTAAATAVDGLKDDQANDRKAKDEKATDGGSRVKQTLLAGYLESFRKSVRPSLISQLIVLAALIVGASDLAAARAWLLGGQPWWLTGPSLAVGVLLVGSATTVPMYLAVLSPDTGLRPVGLRQAAGLAYGRPMTSLILCSVGLVLGGTGFALPVLSPLLIGIYLQVGSALVSHTHRRIQEQRPRKPRRSCTANRSEPTDSRAPLADACRPPDFRRT